MNPSKIKGVIFDLDGTLIDSFQAIYLSFRHVYENMGMPTLSLEQVKSEIGLGLTRTFSELLGPERVAEALRLFDEKYVEIFRGNTFLLPGAQEVLTTLHARGCKMAIATNKIGRYSRAIFKHFGMEKLFSAILGDKDVLQIKPHPEMVYKAMAEMGTQKEETIMVGDSLVDIETAHNAGVPILVIPTGLSKREDLEKARPDRILERLTDLLIITES
ncbi:MAG: HAD-IA family hydrolase [Deltaproteobacteria bacterium]|nr:HAD-IA family hydrolase [Deltaproteobacteria bacterium]